MIDTTADLAITKTVSDTTPNENDTIDYTITVTNNGPDDATGVVVGRPLPAGVTYVSDDAARRARPPAGVWTIGSLANGASATLVITVTVDNNTGGDTVDNTACVDGDQDDDTAPTTRPPRASR